MSQLGDDEQGCADRSAMPKGIHQWKAANRNQQKTFMQCFENNKMSETCILLIGVTGSGKSSICKIMGCNEAIIGHLAKSETKFNCILRSQYKQYTFVDTKGTDDSNDLESNNENIMKEILYQCFHAGISNVKIIWTISGDTTRACASYQGACKFINSLSNNAWDSTIIIKKGGCNDDNINGIIESIRSVNNNVLSNSIKSRFFGVTCVDASFKPDASKLRMYETILRGQKEGDNPTSLGYYTKSQYIDLLKKEINKLNGINLKWKIETCQNCSEIGDSRYVSTQCHYRAIRYHGDPKGQRFHCGSKVRYHNGNWVENTEVVTVERDTIYDGINQAGKSSAGLGWLFYLHPGVHIARLFESNREKVNKSYYKWSCCQNRNPNSSGCQSKCNSCGHAWSSVGCANKCGHCGQMYESNGCKTKCSKCDKQWGKTKCYQK